jgi:hypothetical protein
MGDSNIPAGFNCDGRRSIGEDFGPWLSDPDDNNEEK